MEHLDTLWYVCTVCNRAFTEATESRAHQRQIHGSAAGVLILSQTDDLTPSVKVTPCSSSIIRQNVGKKRKIIKYLTPVVRLDPCDSGGSPSTSIGVQEPRPRKKGRTQQSKVCKVCRMEFPKTKLLKNHVLLFHVLTTAADGGGGSSEEEVKVEENELKSDTTEDPDSEVGLEFKMECDFVSTDLKTEEERQPPPPVKLGRGRPRHCYTEGFKPTRSPRRPVVTTFPRTDEPFDTIVYNFTKIFMHKISAASNTYFCSSCGFGSFKLGVVQKHVRREHSLQPCSCFVPTCKVTFSKRTEFGKHLKQAHVAGADYWACTRRGCEMTCKTEGELQDHIKIHSKWKRVTRRKARRPLVRVDEQEEAPMELQDDLEVKLEPPDEEIETETLPLSRLRCRQPPCGQRLESLHYNGVEINKWRVPEGGIRYCCTICMSSNPQLAVMTRHVRDIHSAVCCACPVCQVKCESLQELDMHMDQAEAHEHEVDYWACVHCKMVFMSLEGRRRHTEVDHSENERDITIPKKWRWGAGKLTNPRSPKCPLCFKGIPTKLMEDHDRREHSEHWERAKAEEPCDCLTCYKDAFLRPSPVLQWCIWSCSLCGHRMLESRIRNHVLKHHPEQKPPAPAKRGAEAAAASEWRAARPTCRDRPTKRMEQKCRNCPDCGKFFSKFESLMSHLITCHGPTTADNGGVCHICNKVFGSDVQLKRHLAAVHLPTRDYLCPIPECGKGFTSKAGLQFHVLLHDPGKNKQFACEKCPATFYDMHHLNRHREKHQERAKMCPLCGKMFKGDVALDSHHKGQHSEDRPFKCGKCEASFPTWGKRRAHEAKTHMEDTPFQCPTCPKGYKSKGLLNAHWKNAHKGPRTCELCQEEFLSPPELWRHEKAVHGIQRRHKYQCTHCDRSFPKRVQLQMHKTTHTSDRPHRCDKCDKTFKRAINLTTHKVTHVPLEELPHLCDQCGTRFRLPHHLRAHRQRIHCKPKAKLVQKGDQNENEESEPD